MRKSAIKAIEAFQVQKSVNKSTKQNIWTDGTTLYSYMMPIARHVGGRIKVVDVKTSPSTTTSNHINSVTRYLEAPAFDIVSELDDVEEEEEKTYNIKRFYQNSAYSSETIKTGLTLEEAHEHCQDSETSSRTCELPENIARTEKYGAWFDGYGEE